MQRRYHSAFSQGKRTEEVEEMQKEHQEADLGPERVEAEMVRKTGRRASISEQPSTSSQPLQESESLPRTEEPQESSPVSLSNDSASASTSQATPFTSEPPPPASKPSTRRNSTSSFSPVRLDKSTFSAPKVTRVREKRPPSSGIENRRSSNSDKTTTSNRTMGANLLTAAQIVSILSDPFGEN